MAFTSNRCARSSRWSNASARDGDSVGAGLVNADRHVVRLFPEPGASSPTYAIWFVNVPVNNASYTPVGRRAHILCVPAAVGHDDDRNSARSVA